MIITLPNKSTLLPKEKYELLTEITYYGTITNEFFNELEQQNVYKINNVTSVLSTVDRRSNTLKNLLNSFIHKTKRANNRSALFYNSNYAYLTKFLTNFVLCNWNGANHTSYVEYMINDYFPVFRKPYSPNSNQFGLSITNNSGYVNCNGLEIKDIYNMWRASDSVEEFNEVIKQLVSEDKINSAYLYADADEAVILELIQNSNTVLSSRMNVNQNEISDIKSILSKGILGLRYLSNFIYAYLLCITKDSLLLELQDDLTTKQHGAYNYIDLCFNFHGIDPYAMVEDQFSITTVNFENLKYNSISSSEEKKYRLIKKYNKYKASNAKQIAVRNEIPVFSSFPKEWLDSIGINYYEKNINLEMPLNIQSVYAKLDDYTSNVADVSTLDDFSFVGDYNLFRAKSKNEIVSIPNEAAKPIIALVEKAFYNDIEKINLKEVFLESLVFTRNKIKALVLNNFTSGNQPFDIEIKELTKTQLTQANNAFVPIAFKTNKVNPFDGEKQEIYFVSLVNFQSLLNFRKYTKSQKYFQYLNNLIENNCIHDPSIYNEILTKRFGNLIKYNLANQDFYQRLGDNFIIRLTDSDTKLMQVINNEKLAILNGSLNLDQNLITKLNNLKNKQDIIFKKYSEEDERLGNLFDSSNSINQDIDNDRRQIEIINSRLQQRLKEVEALPGKIELQQKITKEQKNLYESISNEVKKLDEIQEKAKKDAIQNKDYTMDSFFIGLKTRNIYITELNYEDSCGNIIVFDAQNADNFNYSNFNNTKEYSLKSVDFIINKPFQIKVDGDSTNIIYAGPMKVMVNDSSISVAPLSSSTILGFINETSATIHPHSSPMGLNTNLQASEFFSYRRGCLGESSPYIYNAFRSQSALKNVLVNSFIWLSSANSSDHWGRNYKFFPKLGDPALINLEQDSIDLITLNESIESSEIKVNSKKQCTHDYENSICVHCGIECINHEFDYDGICSICGHYESDYDESEEYEDEIEEQAIEAQPTTYTPYSPLTNNNN